LLNASPPPPSPSPRCVSDPIGCFDLDGMDFQSLLLDTVCGGRYVMLKLIRPKKKTNMDVRFFGVYGGLNTVPVRHARGTANVAAQRTALAVKVWLRHLSKYSVAHCFNSIHSYVLTLIMTLLIPLQDTLARESPTLCNMVVNNGYTCHPHSRHCLFYMTPLMILFNDTVGLACARDADDVQHGGGRRLHVHAARTRSHPHGRRRSRAKGRITHDSGTHAGGTLQCR
jgi:hypothetical protein